MELHAAPAALLHPRSMSPHQGSGSPQGMQCKGTIQARVNRRPQHSSSIIRPHSGHKPGACPGPSEAGSSEARIAVRKRPTRRSQHRTLSPPSRLPSMAPGHSSQLGQLAPCPCGRRSPTELQAAPRGISLPAGLCNNLSAHRCVCTGGEWPPHQHRVAQRKRLRQCEAAVKATGFSL